MNTIIWKVDSVGVRQVMEAKIKNENDEFFLLTRNNIKKYKLEV